VTAQRLTTITTSVGASSGARYELRYAPNEAFGGARPAFVDGRRPRAVLAALSFT